MTDSFQGGSFEPERSEDYVAPLINSYKEINEGMNNYWSQELSNYKNAAQDAGKDMMLLANICLLYTSPSPRDCLLSRMPSSA